MKFFLVGGTFDENGGRKSGLIDKLGRSIALKLSMEDSLRVVNGGKYDTVEYLLESCNDCDVVLWMANVPNELPKIRNVKEVAPHCIYINSKRNDNNKYSFQELINRSLGVKANLTVEFSKEEDGAFNMMLFDPLGAEWYNGTSINELSDSLVNRVRFLRTITREGTLASDKPYDSDLVRLRDTEEHEKFVSLVRDYADVFHNVIKPAKEVTRFLGNASLRPNFENFRCTKGFPTFREGSMIFVSRRNVDKQTLSLEDFVPVYFDSENKLRYIGNNKPSVDTPIQIRLYTKLPNINYMIHSHCYIENAPFTKVPIPCGGLEEVDEVLKTLEEEYGTLDKSAYVLNLNGHGNIVMGSTVADLENIKFISRPLPERIIF